VNSLPHDEGLQVPHMVKNVTIMEGLFWLLKKHSAWSRRDGGEGEPVKITRARRFRKGRGVRAYYVPIVRFYLYRWHHYL